MNPERWSQIEELYHATLEREPDGRNAYLAEVCGADAGLRLEVEALLEQGDALNSLLEKPALQRLGPYAIVDKLGSGGMGEVYRATDTRLRREVAVKVCAERFSGRFEREARAVAALNHPNICALFDVGPNYLVMELVEGETLAKRMKPGAIPLEEALAIARQIADALEAAHEKGIVHRDLKPGNIMIKPDGMVKVLDFGLAKMAEPDPGAMTGNTLTLEPATLDGAIMGTAGYMAPEQARGNNIDKRVDIFAFGVVLYEMVRGRRLFEGETVSDTLAKILTQEPDLRVVPLKVRRLLGRCLEKDPKKRLRDIGEAWAWLEEAPPANPERSRWLPWGVAALLAASLSSLLWWRAPAPEVRSTQFLIEAPGDTQFTSHFGMTAISPDGRYLIFGAGPTEDLSRLWLRPLDSINARPLQGTEGGHNPFWSPDSKSIAFYSGGKLRRTDIVGGAPQVLCDAAFTIGGGGTWNRDGVILFGSADELFRIPTSGGVRQQVTQRDTARKESGHGMPQFLPDGIRFLYFVHSTEPNTQGIYTGSLDNPKEHIPILVTERKAYYVAPRDGRTGFLLHLRGQTLVAQPFNIAKLRLEGDPAPLVEDVAVGATFRAAFWTSDAGLLVYRTGTPTAKAKLIWMSRSGKHLGQVGKEDRYGAIRLSPDGNRVAISRYDDSTSSDIWVWEIGREIMTRVTFDPINEASPNWSPDGRQIAYYSGRSGVWQIYRREAGGGGQEEQLTSGPNHKLLSDWSRDGRYLLYSEQDPKTGLDLWALPLDGERKPVALLQTPFAEGFAQFSPDGKWIAYQSDASGRTEVYVRAFPVSSGQWQVSNQGGFSPRWSANGKEVFYLGPTLSNVLAAGVRVAGASFQSDTPRELFPILPVQPTLTSTYDVTADGQRFLVVQPSGSPGPAPLTVVNNWQSGLKK